jgi:DNA-binding NtrC family response regulator
MADARQRRLQRLLVIDDDPSVHLIARDVFNDGTLEVLCAESAAAGLQLARERRPDVVLLDHYLPDGSGVDVYQSLRELDARLPVIWITASSESATAIEATRIGAFDYLTTPIDLERLARQVQQALTSRQLMLVPVGVVDAQEAQAEALIGRSPAMQEVYKAIGRLAASDVPVLLVGQPGTGKQLAARAIHQHGPRAAQPFVEVRCRDLPPGELSRHLFGEVLADGSVRRGRIDQAAGGVLLLEDLASIDLATQSQLLRLVKEQSFARVGSDAVEPANVNLIITAQHDPEALVRDEQLHTDFYFLLSAFMVRLPPLCERAEDIPLLVEHFVRRFGNVGQSFGNQVLRVSHDALHLLQSYSWPGNVAELQAVLRRALLETKGTVLASDYLRRALRHDQEAHAPRAESVETATRSASGDEVTDWPRFVKQRIAANANELYAEAMAEMERHVLAEILAYTRGNQAQAAKILGITRTSLRKRIHSLGISIPRVSAG